MSNFEDKNGDSWTVSVTPHERDLVVAHCQFDFYDFVNKDKAADLMSRLEGLDEQSDDLVRTLLWCCCTGAEHDRQAFDSGMYADALDAGLEAFFVALQSFYRSPQHKQIIANFLTLMDAAARKHSEIASVLGEKTTDVVRAAIDEINPRQLVEQSTSSVMSSPDSPASTPSPQMEPEHGDTRCAS